MRTTRWPSSPHDATLTSAKSGHHISDATLQKKWIAFMDCKPILLGLGVWADSVNFWTSKPFLNNLASAATARRVRYSTRFGHSGAEYLAPGG